ncbi:hypothetical protein MKX03_009094 [Papaver bracteatum]|nr:hypothetical protein MKX03_009094 [Papaver bracteatum]
MATVNKQFISVGCLGLGVSVLYQYQGFWAFAEALENMKDFQQNFKAFDTDLILASAPKSGTVWLKALAFAIVNRYRYPIFSSSHHHPLLTITPHDRVPFVDFKHLWPACSLLDFTKSSSHADHYDSPYRLIAIHFPYPSLPESIMDSATNCKTVYICRNPHDTFISLWHFFNKIRTMFESNDKITVPPADKTDSTPLLIEDAFEFLCDGISKFGPYWDHVLGYWKASLEKPHKKGEVGDWKNYFTPLMVERLAHLMEDKFHGSGLAFQNSIP